MHSKTAGPLGNLQHFLGIKKYIEIRKEIIKRPIIFSDPNPHAGHSIAQVHGHGGIAGQIRLSAKLLQGHRLDTRIELGTRERLSLLQGPWKRLNRLWLRNRLVAFASRHPALFSARFRNPRGPGGDAPNLSERAPSFYRQGEPAHRDRHEYHLPARDKHRSRLCGAPFPSLGEGSGTDGCFSGLSPLHRIHRTRRYAGDFAPA